MNGRMISGLRRLALAAFCVAAAGCSGRMAPTTRPTVAAGGGADAAPTTVPGVESAARLDGYQPGFYPLRVGNRWDYLVTVIYRMIPNQGEPMPPEAYPSMASRQQVATETIDGRQYVIEDAILAGGEASLMTSTRYRQDVTGLYELDLMRDPSPDLAHAAGSRAATADIEPGGHPMLERSLAGRPPAEQAAYRLAARRLRERIAALGAAFGPLHGARVAGTARLGFPGPAGPNELTRLRYPLEAKSHWAVRTGIPIEVVSEVIDAETLELRPGDLFGYRIRVRSSWMGPNDSYEIWFGPSGFLQSVLHAELDAVDNAGEIIGRVTVDQREELQSIHLAGPAVVTLPPWLTPPRK